MTLAPDRHPSQKPFAACLHPTHSMLARAVIFAAFALAVSPQLAHSQASDPKAQQTIEAAVQAELAASHTDKSTWHYRDQDIGPDKNAIYDTIETPQGELKRLTNLNGRPIEGAARDTESTRIANYVNDPSAQARARKASAHDDAQAEEMTKMLPHAFIWTIGSETPEFTTLNYRPNPNFNPPDYEARVMGTMAGQVIVARDGNRIRTLRGALTEDVKFGFGFFGRLNKGGSFDIERRQVGGGHWQITESHVHIGGHALLFKNIGQQDDETKTDWKPSTAANLREAEEQLRAAK